MTVGDYEYDEENQKMRINFLGSIYGESIEDYKTVMAITIDKLMELRKVPRLVIAGVREYEYDFQETKMLTEIASAIDAILRQKIISLNNIVIKGCESESNQRFAFLQSMLNDLRYDPIDAYKKLLREIRHISVKQQREMEFTAKACYAHYMKSSLLIIKELLDSCKMIQVASPMLAEHKDRSLYRKIFHPTVRPNFIYTRYISLPPQYAELVDRYQMGDTEVQIYKMPGKLRMLYHIVPPEFRLTEEEYTMLDRAREYLGRHEPREGELTEPERIRENLFRIGTDLLRDMKPNMPEERLTKLANILARYTAGLGIIDLILQDENVQDIAINSPIGSTPIYLYHGNHLECETNIIPSKEDAESWATRFRLSSGRPLDEANPVLDTELAVPGGRARVAAITRTLSPDGLGFALRRHRDNPWTYPLFIKNGFIDSFSAGLMWFLVDGARTMLIAGTRSSGKCLDGDELIHLPTGELKKIRDIVEEEIKKGSIKCDDGFYAPTDIEVLTMEDNLKITPKKATYVWKRKSPEKLIKITTSTGKEIVTTPEHPYFTLKNGCVEKANATDITKEMRIATPRIVPTINSENKISLEDFDSDMYVDVDEEFTSKFTPTELKNLTDISYSGARKWISSKSIPLKSLKFLAHAKNIDLSEYKILSGKTTSVSINMPDRIDDDFAEFLGYLYGDGHIDRTGVQLSNQNTDVLNRFLQLGEKIFNLKGRIEHPKNRTAKAHLQSKTLARLLNDLVKVGFGRKADKITIPIQIIKNKELSRAFIKAYFDCDGTVNKTGEIELATASKDMSKQLQLCLLSFGIVSFTKVRTIKNRKYYRILIRGNEAVNYMKEISFSHEKKRQRLENFVKQRKTITTNIDSLPSCGKILKEIRMSIRINPNELRSSIGKDYWAYENEKYNPTVNWFRKIINFYSDKFNERKELESAINEMEKSRSVTICQKLIRSLNIENEELAKITDLNVMTISNFKNNIYAPREESLSKIILGIKAIWQNCVEKVTEDMINKAKMLANSDIFWDKIVKIQHVTPKEEWVYDLTIDDTHNFLASGFIAHNTSFLGATMVQIMPKLRIVSVEDTLEIPVEQLRDLGFNIERMKARSVITHIETELPAEEALRTALRLGDSALIIGEVRSVEAKALYEAMRIGALANVVAGTIHGDSAYGVFDRVVNDLNVPPTSFKATDIILIANMLRSADGLRSFRRAVEITEVRKHWKNDPEEEGGFVNLAEYSARDDMLKPTKTLLTGESIILNDIASRVRDWRGRWDAVWQNINLRSKIFSSLVDYSKLKPYILEAPSVIESNSQFHILSQQVKEEIGELDSAMIYERWKNWLRSK